MLPHRYPFRFVGGGMDGGQLVIAVSLGSPWLERAPALGLALAIEMMAQAAHVLLQGGPTVYLAGVENAEIYSPIEAGDRLDARAEMRASFGGMTQVVCALEREGSSVAKATLILVNGPGKS